MQLRPAPPLLRQNNIGYILYKTKILFREAISGVCDRNGVDVDTINVYLESSRTPLPLLTSETSWLGGRHIRIRAKDESKSPVRLMSSSGGGGPQLLQAATRAVSVTAPSSRKTSAANNVRLLHLKGLIGHYPLSN